MAQNGTSSTACRLVVVGDVHDAWSERDVASLLHLQPSMVLFVGDFGNEAVSLVAQVAQVALPKAVILGNHDAWYTMTGPRARKKPWSGSGGGAGSELLHAAAALLKPAAAAAAPASAAAQGTSSQGAAAGAPAAAASSSAQQLPSSCQMPVPATASCSEPPLPKAGFEGVEAQLQLLGEAHIGFSSMPVPGHDLAILGARPFSKGGGLESVAPFYEQLYGMSRGEDFTAHIVREGMRAATANGPAAATTGASAGVEEAAPGPASEREAALQQGGGRAVVLLAHNGPSGLGSAAHSPCGIDWLVGEGDHGDKDLRDAIEQLREAGVKLPLVLFGHMHHVLCGGRGRRRMVHVDPCGTVYLNAATVPRVRKPPPPGSGAPAGRRSASGRQQRRVKAKTLPPHLQAVSAPVQSSAPTQHHFMVVELEGGEVAVARDVWVEVQPPPAPASGPADQQDGGGEGQAEGAGMAFETCVVQEQELFRRLAEGPAWCSYHDAAAGLERKGLRAELVLSGL